MRGIKHTLFCIVFLWSTALYANDDFSIRGFVEADVRFAIPGKSEPDGVDPYRFIRSDTTGRLTAMFNTGDVTAYADLAVVFSGFPQADTLDGLLLREQVDPLRFESDALYLSIEDWMADGIDLRIGRQILHWGTADMFNPTNVVNAYDFEDPLKFGEAIATEMLVLSLTAPWYSYSESLDVTVFDEFSLTLVAVPVFRPGMLPASAMAAFSDPDLFRQLVDSPTLTSVASLQTPFLEGGGTLVYDTGVKTPDFAMDNIQLGSRMRWTLLGMDMSLSYYRGFDDTPRAERVEVRDLPIPVTEEDLNDLDKLEASIKALNLDNVVAQTDVMLTYPKVHVLGADLSTSLDFLGGLGLWAEFAMTFHDDLYRYVSIDQAQILEREAEKGSFWKLTAGMDYSITSWWYANVQYIHGFVDEFGAAALNDYIVAGSDFKAFAEQLTIRTFVIYQIQDQSMVMYPQLIFKFWPGTELTAGAFVFLGDEESKFGSRITGPSTVFLKGRYNF